MRAVLRSLRSPPACERAGLRQRLVSRNARRPAVLTRSMRPVRLARAVQSRETGGTIVTCLAFLIALTSATVAVRADAPRDARSHRPRPGSTWDSMKALPDWSGVWVLSDASWTAAFAGATGRDGGTVPLTPRYRALRATHLKDGDISSFENESKCIPDGIPGSLGLPHGHEYLFTPGRVTVIVEDGVVRRIDTSGRPHPAAKDLEYSFAGNSIGHWDGRTLIVDTVGISSQAEFLVGLHTTEKTHLTERIFRRDRNTLEIDAVMTDPAIFVKPWSFTRLYERSTLPPFEYHPCGEGTRDIMVDGRQTGVDMTPPPASGK